MKKILIMLSSIIFLVIANNGIVKPNENAMLTKQPITNKENENNSSLFNNKYGYLSNSDWITNQSAIDGNFYSYDTSHLTNAGGSPWYLSDGKTDARNAFKVDSNGQLVANIKISDQDKADLENSKAEMVKDRKITKLKYDYDPYRSSAYSDQYFNDKNNKNNNWQYLQFSSSGKRIDISNQKDANKVEYSNNLSEAWGLYYIAKAVKENRITQTVADSLANDFISQSSLQGKISNSKVVDEIINLIITNNDIYDLLRTAPIKVTAKNYSLNFIFDSNNNLIKVNYQKISFALNFSYEESFNGTASHNLSNRNIHYLFNTTDYFNDWNDFCNNCGTIGFTSDSLVAANGKYSKEEIKGSKLNINTKMIPENNGVLEQKWMVTAFYDGGAFGAHYDLTLEIYFIHLNNELAFYWDLYEDSSMCNQGISFTINIKPIFNF